MKCICILVFLVDKSINKSEYFTTDLFLEEVLLNMFD